MEWAHSSVVIILSLRKGILYGEYLLEDIISDLFVKGWMCAWGDVLLNKGYVLFDNFNTDSLEL